MFKEIIITDFSIYFRSLKSLKSNFYIKKLTDVYSVYRILISNACNFIKIVYFYKNRITRTNCKNL